MEGENQIFSFIMLMINFISDKNPCASKCIIGSINLHFAKNQPEINFT